MRLIEEILELEPGRTATARRVTKPDDWYFQGHFPEEPVVPAIVLVEMIAQTGGIAAYSSSDQPTQTMKSARVAAFADFRFPGVAGPGADLRIRARVVAQIGALTRVEGEVLHGDTLLARGSVTLAEVSSGDDA